ncbi:hypothetical protein EVAR_31808_1 [Eumeta japonica]|uniref:Uncharacterized protein n=1 Tax=Eumeta variegata TaxID=151549 RepID=A0A4C1W4C2_EUMVA|nr:hypothetical protein EVAR_31808_1 [Eumeta japonica]
MELEDGHRNSVIKRRNPIEFGLVFNDAKENAIKERRKCTSRGRRRDRTSGAPEVRAVVCSRRFGELETTQKISLRRQSDVRMRRLPPCGRQTRSRSCNELARVV